MNPNASVPWTYHFIGHSFGTAVVSETVERFAAFNLPVDHVTYLDPHDFDQSIATFDTTQELWTTGKPTDGNPDKRNGYGASIWSNVAFADVYYQTRGRGDFLPDSLIPLGRPIPGAYNVWLQPGDPRLLTDWKAGESDHGAVWAKYYTDSIKLPSAYSDGYGFSRVGLPASGGLTRPTHLSGPGAFYSSAQDHRFTSELLVPPSYGDPTRSLLPNYPKLAELGLTQSAVNNGRWAPEWQTLAIFNGDFHITGINERIPGWSYHNGGISAETEAQAGSLGYGNANIKLVHNYTYIPTNAASLTFTMSRHVEPFQALSFAEGRHKVLVKLGTDTIGEISSSALTLSLEPFRFAIPVSLRGETRTITFELTGPRQSSNSRERIFFDDLAFSTVEVSGPKPDLTADRVSTNVATVNAGGSLTIDSRVANVGPAASDPFQVRFVLRTPSENSNSPGIVLGSPFARPALATYGTAARTETVPVPAGTPSGEYFLWIDVDPANAIDESDDGNNWWRSEATITVNVPPVARADLKMESLTPPTAAVLGANITVESVVRNLGSAAAPAYEIQYWISDNTSFGPSDRELTASPIVRPALAAGGTDRWSQSLLIPADLTPGEWWIFAIPNQKLLFPESNLDNNFVRSLGAIRINAPVAPDDSSRGFQFPIGNPLVATNVTQRFNESFTRNGVSHVGHLGVDFGFPKGTVVWAAADGEVVYSQNAGVGWDRVIIVKHFTRAWGWDKDVYTMYAHVSPSVTKGDRVKRGQPIATVAAAAQGSTGPHLHFELRSSPNSSDAELFPGPGYHYGSFTQVQPNGYRVPSYGKDIVWHDPLVTFQGSNLFTPTSPPPPPGVPPSRIDLSAALVNAPSSATPGSIIPIYFEVYNNGSTASGSYTLDLVLSDNDIISEHDGVLQTVSRPSVAPGAYDRFTAYPALPGNLTIGKSHWVGLRVDPDRQVEDLLRSNNEKKDATPLVIAASGAPAQADLIGAHLAINSYKDTFTWGDTAKLDYRVQNVGTAASVATKIGFYLTNDPVHPTFSEFLGEESVPSIRAGEAGRPKTFAADLPDAPPAGYTGGTLYIVSHVNHTGAASEANTANNRGRAEGEDWVPLPFRSILDLANGTADLVGIDFEMDPRHGSLKWGQYVEAVFTTKNVGDGIARPHAIEVYLSTNSTISRSDHKLEIRGSELLMPGQEHVDRVPIWLPDEPPEGFSSGTLYIGILIDPDDLVDESSNLNNASRGAGLDYAVVSIVPSPPTSNVPEPVIGSFTATPEIIRGQRVELRADNVLDDNNAVNEVVFRLDSNFNGQWDESDLYVAHGSKDGITFTASPRSDIRWPVGAVTLMARAKDNHGLVSTVHTADITVIGAAGGPFQDDNYENNDTPDSATFLGGGTGHALTGLALAAGGVDYYVFDIYGPAGSLVVTIDFLQDDYLGFGVPTGDLTLEVRRANGGSPNGFSDTSQPGPTSESVTFAASGQGVSLASGRYLIRVAGQGSHEQNAAYDLSVAITPVDGAPIAGPLLVSRSELVQGESITLTMDDASITNVDPLLVDGVHFYADFDRDGQLDPDREYLGSDWGPGGEGPNDEYTIAANTASWPPGTIRLVAFVSKINGLASLAELAEITLLPNHCPSIDSFLVDPAPIQGVPLLLVAANVTDPDPNGVVHSVRFWLDRTGEGTLDPDDEYLGTGTRAGSDWSLAVDTSEWPLGTFRVFAIPTDALGLDGLALLADGELLASDNTAPTIGLLTAPEFAFKGDSIPLLAADVTDPNGDPHTVDFYLDADRDGVYTPNDTHLGTGTNASGSWSFDATSANLIQGEWQFFAVVRDTGVPSFSSLAAISVTILDLLGPRIVGSTPASAPGSIDSIRVTFDEPVDPATFTTSDIASFTGPSGSLSVDAITEVAGSDGMQFEIAFARQNAGGAYTIVFGPNIVDVAGNPMNQDADGTNGESGADAATVEFAVTEAAAEFEWGKTIGGANTDIAWGLATDSSGNVYVTGEYEGTADFDPGPGVTNLTAVAGSRDIFIAKYTSAGALVWARSVGGSSDSELGDEVAVDPAGNVYITGYFAGTADFDPGAGTFNMTSVGPNAAFLLKLNSSGIFQWAKQMSGGKTIGRDVIADASGVAFTGSFLNTVNFDGDSRTSAGDNDIFIAKWNSAGTRQWVQTFGGTGYDLGYGVATDATGAIYGAGIINGSVAFGGTTLNTGNGYLVKITSAGALEWAQATGGYGLDVAATSGGTIYLAGEIYSASTDIDPGPGTLNLPFQGGTDVFVAKYESNGNFTWARSAGSSGSDTAYGVAVDSTGNVVVAGHFEGAVDFDPGATTYTIANAGQHDAFVFKWLANGTHAWARALGGASTDRAYDVAVGASNATYVAGYFAGTAVSDPGGATEITLNAAGASDGFFARIVQPPPNSPPNLNSIGDQSVNEGSTLSFTASATDPEGKAIAYSLAAGAPAGASIHATTGVFTWTPTEAQGPGTYSITVRATDAGSPAASATRTFSVQVGEVNAAPVLAAIADLTVFEGVAVSFQASASDADLPANGLGFSLVNAPAGATIDAASGLFSWTPTEAQGPGSFTMSVRVTDDGTPPLSHQRSFTITVRESNRLPVIEPIGNKTVEEETELRFTAIATDPDLPANGLVYTLVNAPSGAAIHATSGLFTWTPTEAQGPGSFTIRLRVTDNGTPSLHSETEFDVAVLEANRAPVLNAIGARSVDEESELSFAISGSDSDLPANSLTYFASGLPSGASFEPATRIFRWTPTELQNGNWSVIFGVTDGSDTAEETVAITVREVNRSPALDAIPDASVNDGATLSFTATASDPDRPNNVLRFELSAGPSGAAIDAATGDFTWDVPVGFPAGPVSATVEVVDDGTPVRRHARSFTITVIDVTAPTIQSMTRLDPTTTNLSTLHYRVVFSEPMRTSDVDAADFTVNASGVTYSSLNVISESSTSFLVTLSGVGGDGTLALAVNGATATLRDLADNLLNSGFTGPTYLVDHTRPTATLTQAASQSDPANTVPIRFAVEFSKPVVSVPTSAFSLSGSAGNLGGASVTVANPSGDQRRFEVSISGLTTDGTVILALPANGVTDAAGNLNEAAIAGDDLVRLDRTPPSVTSIVRHDPTGFLTNASSVQFAVTFSEAVTQVSLADFALGTSGLGGASLADIAGSGTSYIVTAITGSGIGTIRLDLIDDDSIRDGANNPLGGGGTQNFSSGQSYSVDRVRPTVANITRLDPAHTNFSTLRFRVAFNEAMANGSVDAADLTAIASGVSYSGFAVNAVSSTTFDAIFTGVAGNGSLGLNVIGAAATLPDLAGNLLTSDFTGPVYTVDQSAPTVTVDRAAGQTSPTNSLAIRFRAQFSEPVVGFGAASFTLAGSAGGLGSASRSVSNPSGDNRTFEVTVANLTGDGTVTLIVPASAATDAVGNTSLAAATDATVNYDTAAPAAAAPDLDPASDSGTSATDNLTNDSTPTFRGVAEPGAIVSLFEGSQLLGTTTAGGGTWSIDSSVLAEGSHAVFVRVEDAAGNRADSPALTVVIDSHGPSSVIRRAAGQGAAATAADPNFTVQFAIQFEGPVSGFHASHVSIVGGSGARIIGLAGSGANYTVTLGEFSAPGPVSVLAAGIGSDAAGNAGQPSPAGESVEVTFATTTMFNGLPSRVEAGQSVVVSATVRTPAGGTPSGAIRFSLTGPGGANHRTIGLNGDTATTTYVALVEGSYSVAATFEPDSGFATSAVSGSFGVGSATGGDQNEVGEHAAAAGNTVTVFRPDGTILRTFAPFTSAEAPTGSRVAVADINGDGTADVVAVTGPGAPALLRAYDGATNALLYQRSLFEGFLGGAFIAAGDLNDDSRSDLIATPDQGGGPRVTLFDGPSGTVITNFFGIDDPNFRGGARATIGDLNGDGVNDVLVSAGFGGGPRVAGFDGRTLLTSREKLFGDFFLFEPALRNGCYVAIGDLNADGWGDIIGGGGPGGGPRVLAFDSREVIVNGRLTPLVNFFAGNTDLRGGVRVAAKDYDGDGLSDLMTGSGDTGDAFIFFGSDLMADDTRPRRSTNFPGVLDGIFVG